MSDAKEVVRRIERGQELDWRRGYARLLPPVPAPTRTPGCTCDWVEERMLCVSEPAQHHARYGEDCPDHEEPERVP